MTRMQGVVPLAGTWIEISGTANYDARVLSFPSRERGLKLLKMERSLLKMRSFPSRERGLKSMQALSRILAELVVPLAGTWIEIRKFG